MKANILIIFYLQVSIPTEALQSFWTEDCRKSWGLKLSAASTPEEFLQVWLLIFAPIHEWPIFFLREVHE